MFLAVEQTLSCEIKTLCYPKAALFAFCLGLFVSNAVALVQGALRAHPGEEPVRQRLSSYYVVLEIKQTYQGMMVAIAPPYWQIFETLSDDAFACVLQDLASHGVLARYRKTPRGPKKPPPPKKRYKNGEHLATSKVIEDRKRG